MRALVRVSIPMQTTPFQPVIPPLAFVMPFRQPPLHSWWPGGDGPSLNCHASMVAPTSASRFLLYRCRPWRVYDTLLPCSFLDDIYFYLLQ